MKLNQFLTSLGKKVNFNLSDDKLKDILASEIEVPDELTSEIEKGLMNEDAALNNSKVISKAKAQVYNGVDSEFENLIEEFGLTEDVVKPIREQKRNTEKIKALVTHFKSEAEKAAKAGNKADAEALRNQVNDLNNQLKTFKAEKQAEINKLKADNENNLNEFTLKTLLGTRQFILPDAMKPEEKIEMVHSIISAELKAKGLKLVRENGLMILRKEDGTEYFDDKNNKVELTSFLDGALAQRGLLKVSDPKTGQQGNGQMPQNVNGKGSELPKSNEQFLAQIDKELAAYPK